MIEPIDDLTPYAVREAADGIRRIIDNVRSIISIDTQKLEHLLAAKLAGGHVILADSHGVGKTSLAKAVAASIRWRPDELSQQNVPIEQFSRIQCTVDLLPQDILGFTRYETSTSMFTFTQGPLFAHFVLCDEINLLTPKTQGSFLQAMEERAVTVEGTTYELPDPFFIIATMNLKGSHLFPLPAPQLDRFMIQLSLGYPSNADEERIVRQHGLEDAWKRLGPVVGADELILWQRMVDKIFIHDEVTSYLVECVRLTRGWRERIRVRRCWSRSSCPARGRARPGSRCRTPQQALSACRSRHPRPRCTAESRDEGRCRGQGGSRRERRSQR